jgi:lipopolysaccharide/colanic/teichoic acid biosynthesis glycosyltransferase
MIMAVAEVPDHFDDKPGTVPPCETAPFLLGESDFHPEPGFDRMLYLERKRTERSHRPFLLLLLNVENLIPDSGKKDFIRNLETTLCSSVRETDIKGWHEQGKVAGIILTELNSLDEVVQEKILLKIQDRLAAALGPEPVEKIRVSYHAFPETHRGSGSGREWFNLSLYPEFTKKTLAKRIPLFLKRGLDIIGSLLGLAILSPVFLAIALGIKLTSKGPVLFKQDRVGQFGKIFTFLKFRSMYVDCDESSHKEYVTKFITRENGTSPTEGRKGGEVVYKMTGDRRITPLGRVLRKTSLDELPQFINVLMGDMSLVGPRPPIPYECEMYDIWHRNRVLAMKPGVTGLWQVEGRSQRTFDEMVRLDLKYIGGWSIWLDLKIILKTPWVMVSGNGGY